MEKEISTVEKTRLNAVYEYIIKAESTKSLTLDEVMIFILSIIGNKFRTYSCCVLAVRFFNI